MPQRPNVVFVFTDQHRPTSLSCAGVEDVHTPHLDRFASQGTRFTNAVCNTPMCSPARATLLTGRHVLGHGLVTNDIAMRTDLPHLAQCLNAAGYRCGYVGKWHLDAPDRGAFIPPGPARRGFDDFWAVANCTHDYNNAHYYLGDDAEPYFHEGYEPFSQTDIAIEYLESRAPQADRHPFCLFLSYGTPHCPYHTAPQEFHAIYADRSFRVTPNTRLDASVGPDGGRYGMFAADSRPLDIIAGYYAHVSATDHAFGRLMAALDRLGLGDNTLVIFTADHGDMLFSQGRGWKCKPWRESVGVPMLVRWPGRIAAGRVCGAPVGLVDMMPTILSLTGVPAPSGMDGADLSALLGGDDSAGPSEQYINFPCMPQKYSLKEWRGVVTSRFTYARTRQRPWLLYDDLADPFQLRNLVDDRAYGDALADLDRRTSQWLARTGDPFATSLEVADRYAPGHHQCVPPYHTNEKVKAAARDPALRRHRRKGQGL